MESQRNLKGRARRRQRQEQATERQSARDKRTPEGQLEVLDSRLGVNVGAKKERKMLSSEVIHDENCPRVEKRIACYECGYPESEALYSAPDFYRDVELNKGASQVVEAFRNHNASKEI